MDRIVLKPGEYHFLKHNGFQCAIFKHDEFLTFNGYVGVPEGHPLFEAGEGPWNDAVDVHGGWTITGYRHLGAQFKELSWAGFDTAHALDYMPGIRQMVKEIEIANGRRKPIDEFKETNLGTFAADTFRTAEYVVDELKKVTKQLKEMTIDRQNQVPNHTL